MIRTGRLFDGEALRPVQPIDIHVRAGQIVEMRDAPDAPPGTVLGTVASYRLSFQMKPVAEAAAQLAGLAIFHPADGSTQVAGTREQLDRFRALLDAVSRFVGGTH